MKILKFLSFLLITVFLAGCSKEDKRVYIESVTIPRTATIEEGQTQKLSATVLPEGITEKYTILWKSSDNTVASVDGNGNIKAVKAGTAKVIAYEQTKQNIKSECEVTITAKPVEIQTVSFKDTPTFLVEGESTNLVVEVVPENINQPYQLEYVSSEIEVATIDNTGKLTAVKAGKTTISVFVKDKPQVKAEFELTVTAKTIPVNSVSFKEAPTELVVDGEQDLIVEVAPENVNEPYELIFTSSDQTVATVSETGRLKALKAGKALIGVFVKNNPEIKAEFELTVQEIQIPIESLSLSSYKGTLEEGSTDQISVSVVPDNINVPYKLVYASSEKSVATVSESGLVTAVKAGTTTISVHVESDERIKAEYTLTVIAKKVEIESIAFQDNQTSLEEGETNQTSLKVSPENINQPYKISYKSSDTGVATIDGKGLVTAVKAGQTTISASVEGKDIKTEYFLTVTAKPIEIQAITITNSRSNMDVGETLDLQVSVSPEGINQGYELIYYSSDPQIASITVEGRITALQSGKTAISVFVNGKQEIRDEYNLLVDEIVNIPDAYFRNLVQTNYDKNGDGKIHYSEIKDVEELNIFEKVTTLKGVEYFNGLKRLYVWKGAGVNLDLSQNKKLEDLRIRGGEDPFKLDLTQNSLLQLIISESTGLEDLVLKNKPELKEVTIRNSNILIEISQCPKLEKVDFHNNKSQKIRVVNCPSLTSCSVLDCTNLISLDLRGSGFTSFTNLRSELSLPSNLEDINLSNCPYLESVKLENVVYKNLDLHGCPVLKTLQFSNIKSHNKDIVSVNLDDCANLTDVWVNGAYFPDVPIISYPNITHISLNNCYSLINLYLGSNKLKELDLSTVNKNLKYLSATNNPLERIYVWKGWIKPAVGWEYPSDTQIIEK